MTTSTQVTSHNFMSVCRQWRHFRKLSQLELELAPAANNYQRHFSWLETGPSQPSHEMVTRLSADRGVLPH